MDTKTYIEKLELIKIDSRINFTDYSKFESDTKTPSFLNYKGLNSFTENVSKQSREDVLNSMLLAQRAATKSFPEETQMADWYTMYFEVLQRLGWLISQKDFNALGEEANALELDKAIFSLLKDLLTGQQINVLLKSLDLLKSLGEDDKRLVAFEQNTLTHNRGNFQLGLAEELNGNVSILGSGFILESKKKIRRILFVKFGKNVMKMKLHFFRAELVTSAYAKNRDFVIKKLGNSEQYIASLDI
ncbi:hypothetical protein [Lutibacter citreus]|uniref:hypothetical protein n=1 Tax=Lutibacter citreus TaxID=2138210 RepID=UPI000DBE0B4F|nr:hypothetical protein [Lutibacter citreus]